MSSTTVGYDTANFQELYTTGLYTDLELLCGDYRWNLHRVIIHQSSPFFAATRDSDYVVSNSYYITQHALMRYRTDKKLQSPWTTKTLNS